MTSGVLVLFAVREERQFFKPSPAWPQSVTVCVTGMGKRNALAEARKQLDSAQPLLVLTCGFAGGLNPGLARNTIIFSADDDSPAVAALSGLGAIPVSFHCAERVAVTRADKRTLRELTGADAVEMESGVIRGVCNERGVPAITLRVISDAADEDLPLDFNALMTPDGRLSFARLAGALLRSPGKIPELLRLQRRTTEAAQALARCLHALLERPLC